MLEAKQPTHFFSATEVAPVREAPAGETPPVPVGPGPSPLLAAPSPRSRRRIVLVVSLVAVAVLTLALLGRRGSAAGEPAAGGQPRTAAVERKDFIQSQRIHGTVEAVEAHAIAAPRLAGQGGSLIITRLIKNGETVHAGDVLVEFDRQAQLKNVLDRQAEYRDLLAQISKKQADQAALLAADETGLKQAEDSEKTAELEMQKNEILSRIDAEKNQQNLEQARATLKQLQQTFDLKCRAARAELRILEIQRDRAQTAMRWAQSNTEKMVVRSPSDGIAVVSSQWKSGSFSEIQEGDEARPGFAILQVVDPRRMQIQAKVNQADIDNLRQGQNARISLDAYQDLAFEGRIERLALVAQGSGFSSRTRTFTVTIGVQGADARLMPDLSAAVDVEVMRQPGALVAPRDAIFRDAGKDFVRVKEGRGYQPRAVQLGPANDVEQVITSGVEKGAVLLRNVTV
ncbi:MAG TPA: efflux RND transporter periplasmic adaptor subunit [Candidatus Saccharimonadales bacterium]|nr:efflux RND transporter periplasmic adaptor subunit [Candidatus Saccharimonadales bacterium]